MTVSDRSSVARYENHVRFGTDPQADSDLHLDALPDGSDRVIRLIDELVRRPAGEARGVRELATYVGSTKSTVARILQDMSESAVAERDSQGTYFVGARLRVLSTRVHLSCSLFRDGGAIVQALADAAGATATISILGANRISGFVAVRRSSRGPIGYSLNPGTVLPLHAGATGRALLCAAGGSIPADLPFASFTTDTITDPKTLQEHLERDMRAGYVLSIGHHFVEAAGLSAPFTVDGIPAAVTITKARTDTTEHDLAEFVPQIIEAAAHLGRLTKQAARTASDHAETTTDASDGGTAVGRLERLIAALAGHPAGLPTGGRALGRVIRANPSTATKLKNIALQSGLATQPTETLEIGPTLLRWAAQLGTSTISELVQPLVVALSRHTGETVGLIELDHGTETARQTLVVQGSQQMHYWMATDAEIPLHAGASGKAILAYLPADTLSRLTLDRFTENTDTEPDSIVRALAEIRDSGVAIGDGERIAEAYGIAAPFFTDGVITGSITVTIPKIRVTHVDTEDVATSVLGAAAQITALLSVR